MKTIDKHVYLNRKDDEYLLKTIIVDTNCPIGERGIIVVDGIEADVFCPPGSEFWSVSPNYRRLLAPYFSN